MGNSKSKKSQKSKEPDRFFEREKWREQKREDIKKKKLNPANKRNAAKENPAATTSIAVSQSNISPPSPSQAPLRSYDSEAIERMRYQINNDADAFLLNNILLSVQFFENYEKEALHIKSNPISEREHVINEAMVKYHKHVFFADRLQECVQEHVHFSRNRRFSEPLTAPRYFIIYDNLEACEPGDSSDYSAVLDAPFYKLCIESSTEPGYVKLKQLEILGSSIYNQNQEDDNKDNESSDSIYTDSERESNSSDDENLQSGEDLLERIKSRIIAAPVPKTPNKKGFPVDKVNENEIDVSGRRRSGPIKQYSKQTLKSNISNITNIKKQDNVLKEEDTSDIDINNRRRSGPIKQYSKLVSKSNISNMKNIAGKELILKEEIENNIDDAQKPRKSILKVNTRRLSGPVREIDTKSQVGFVRKNAIDQTIAEDTETSGYRSNSSSLHNSSEPESDYGYTTITELTTPRRIDSNYNLKLSSSSAVLPDDVWTTVHTKAIDQWSDDDDDIIDGDSSNLPKALYETNEYLNSLNFMTSFVDNFMMKIGPALGLSKEAVENALTQGASIYCDAINNDKKSTVEIIPALIAAWPNTANQWIIRERKIIQNPRTNFSYQWPTKYMVSKSIGFGCLLVPVGFRPKRGVNQEQKLQWRIIFPAAERYLESCLAHSHIRCYLFALTLYKAFLENVGNKIGVDASHIKNHLLWQCEDNYAKWPEDRLGESLRLFLKTFYVSFGHSKFPNYFMDTCNDFKSFPTPLMLKLQRKMADILESPVMHVLHALNKLTYLKKDYYPNFNSHKLYNILTCKNPLRLLNPQLPAPMPMSKGKQPGSDDEYDQTDNVWDRAKSNDKNYQWKKEKQRQMQERRKAQSFAKKRASTVTAEMEIDKNIVVPKKLEAERRRLVLEFFIPHFIAMARSSEKFDAIKQAIIYLEQAQRLCSLLLEEPAGDLTANEYLNVIRDKLTDCQRKLVIQGGYNLPPRHDHHLDRKRVSAMKKLRPRYENIVSQDSPTESSSYPAFTFVDVHNDAGTSGSLNVNQVENISEEDDDSDDDTESKL